MRCSPSQDATGRARIQPANSVQTSVCATLTTVSARLGGNYNPAENFVLTLGQQAAVTLGSGNDVVLSSQVWFIDLGGHTTYQLPESRIDGGPIMKRIQPRARGTAYPIKRRYARQ